MADVLPASVGVVPAQHFKPEPESAPLAPIDRRHNAYDNLLRELVLAAPHRQDLRRRGLSDSAIDRIGCRSAPDPTFADDIARELDRNDLDGVPGFYRVGHVWRMAPPPPGYFVPYRDVRGRIQATQCRLDHPLNDGKTKYLWLSSNPELTDDRGRQRYPHGTKSGTPVHFALHHLLAEADEITITEGGLKAEVVAYFTQKPVVGVPGVSNFGHDIALRLKACAPKLRRVLVAYDRDLIEKVEVQHAFRKLCDLLVGAGLTVRALTWPGPWKGYDDYLLAKFNER